MLPRFLLGREYLPRIFGIFGIMATCLVRFEFWCDGGPKKLEYVHSLPKSLITAATTTRKGDAAYADLFLDALRPVTQRHEAACLAASNDSCGICGSPTEIISQIPMSWLHKPEDPYIALWVSAICGNHDCGMQTQQQVQGEITELISRFEAKGASGR